MTLSLFDLYGDRTNSLVTLCQDLEEYRPERGEGLIRFLETRRARIAASEPLAPPGERADLLRRFAAASPKRCTVFPVGEPLARQLAEQGFTIRQVGAEPVFDLARYFGLPVDPLAFFPLARTLKKRGGEVSEVRFGDLDPAEAEALRRDMRTMTRTWLDSRPGLPLGFLSTPRPLALAERKKYFVLRIRGELAAFVAAAPFRAGEAKTGYFLADIVRRPDARSGANDLLILETMRLLRGQGAAEARLGMAPLARLGPEAPGLFAWLARNWTLGYNFKSLADYKQKFQPTRWDPLYMASTAPGLASALSDVLQAHFPDGVGRAALVAADRAWGANLRLTPEARAAFGPGRDILPGSLREYLARTKFTTALVALFTGLHLARLHVPAVADLFARSAYTSGDPTWLGLLVGPAFHNHWFHLVGDQLSLYVFGAACELILGPLWYWLVAGTGLWLSNPLTHLIYLPWLGRVRPEAWQLLLTERDYGSSNAVFALVGAWCALLERKKWLLVPFLVYGAFICWARHSLIALHHPLSLALGYALGLLWVRARAGREGEPRPGD